MPYIAVYRSMNPNHEEMESVEGNQANRELLQIRVQLIGGLTLQVTPLIFRIPDGWADKE